MIRKTAFALIYWVSSWFCISKAFAQNNSSVIEFASDTQAPMFVETLFLKSNHNQKATEMIFNDVVTTHPQGLFILGDVVSMGYQNGKWRKIDSYLKKLTQNNIPVYATLGNHELMFRPAKGAKNFQARFPAHNATGYTEITDSVAVVLLNSNFDKLTAADVEKQDKWYNTSIKQLDSSAAVKYIIVGCHHSPFTNSTIVKPSLVVRQKFVPAFNSSKKCMLFISGHSHNFERFKIDGKYFLVIGGGGGLHQPLNTIKESSHDLSANYKPMFHYLMVKRYHDSLQVTSRELKKNFSGFKDGLTFTAAK